MNKMQEIKKVIENCTECMVCTEHCGYLNHYGLSPRELAERIQMGDINEMPEMPFSCNLCGLCRQFCPAELDIGRMCLEARETLYKKRSSSLPGHRFVKANQDFAVSDAFTLALPDPGSEKCERVFFPGCSLPAYSPSLAMKTYEYLRQKLPGTGIVLGCCGKQTLSIGNKPGFEEVLEKTLGLFKRLGTSEVIVACPECYHALKTFVPGLRSIFFTDVLLKIGLPDNTPACEETFSIHDSCSVRDEAHILDSIRTLLKKMGCGIKEMAYSRENTRCCGSGGMVPFSNPKLASRVIKARAGEAPCDILTYCAGCRETLGPYKPALHILDLVFNPDWRQTKNEPPKTGKARRENQAALKTALTKK